MDTAELVAQLATALKAAKKDLREEQSAAAKTEQAPPKLLLTPESAAKRLDVGRTTIFALMKSGELQSVRIGRSRRIPTSALEEYVEKLAEHS